MLSKEEEEEYEHEDPRNVTKGHTCLCSNCGKIIPPECNVFTARRTKTDEDYQKSLKAEAYRQETRDRKKIMRDLDNDRKESANRKDAINGKLSGHTYQHWVPKYRVTKYIRKR